MLTWWTVSQPSLAYKEQKPRKNISEELYFLLTHSAVVASEMCKTSVYCFLPLELHIYVPDLKNPYSVYHVTGFSSSRLIWPLYILKGSLKSDLYILYTGHVLLAGSSESEKAKSCQIQSCQIKTELDKFIHSTRYIYQEFYCKFIQFLNLK